MRDWYKNKVVQVACHVFGWLVFFSVPVLLRPDFHHDGLRPSRLSIFSPESMILHVFVIGVFYLNAYVLMPRFLNRRKVAYYVIALVLVFAATVAVGATSAAIHDKRLSRSGALSTAAAVNLRARGALRPPVVFAVFSVAFVLAVSVAYRFILERLRFESLQQMRQTERLRTELSFLRSQISPHFIFNVLNSAVSLARMRSDQLEPMLIKLSNLLRYMLYNADDEQVPLKQEIEYLESYIDLQKMRFEEDLRIDFTRTGTFIGHMIEPMLLIPFVENAFKHGIGRIDSPAILIKLVEGNGRLSFHVRNRFDPQAVSKDDRYSGIGLTNVRKRLALLYDDKYTLDISVQGAWFEVTLNLVLK